MNINPLIEAAFENFTVDGEQIPIEYMNYNGSASTYLTYYTWSEVPELWSDNDYHTDTTWATIDIWSPNNFKNILAQVKLVLKNNGFTWTDTGAETYETDTKYFHVSVNFYI